MALQVFGTGMGRTGTMSLKLALEELGFGKCYHMFELFQHPEGVKYFHRAERGEAVSWDELFRGYHSAVDFPVVRFYKQILEQYPDVNVVHTMRDPESWYKSAMETIFWASKPSLGRKLDLAWRMPFSSALRKRLPILQYTSTLLDEVFGKDLHDKETVIRKYNEFNAEVLRTVPKERFLLYDVKSGWEPLCRFLKVPLPSTAFPKSNSRSEFMGQVKKIASGSKELV